MKTHNLFSIILILGLFASCSDIGDEMQETTKNNISETTVRNKIKFDFTITYKGNKYHIRGEIKKAGKRTFYVNVSITMNEKDTVNFNGFISYVQGEQPTIESGNFTTQDGKIIPSNQCMDFLMVIGVSIDSLKLNDLDKSLLPKISYSLNWSDKNNENHHGIFDGSVLYDDGTTPKEQEIREYLPIIKIIMSDFHTDIENE